MNYMSEAPLHGSSTVAEQNIKERAYYLWLEAGSPDGLADKFWVAARGLEEAAQRARENAAGKPIRRVLPSINQRRWFAFSPDIVKDENAKLMLDRGDSLIKAQEDGMRAMGSRMTSLLGVTVTLLTAGIAATITAIGGGTNPPSWVQPWTIPALCTLVGFWMATAGLGGLTMVGNKWTSGVIPFDVYRPDVLSRNVNRLRMSLARTMRDAIDANHRVVTRYSRHLTAVMWLLLLGPITSVLVALWVSRASWIPVVAVLDGPLL